MALLVGPPGSGKSAALRLVARESSRGVHEWCAPVPTLWAGAGTRALLTST